MNSRLAILAASLVLSSIPCVAYAAIPHTVSLSEAPRAAPSFTYPSCSNVDLGGLPPRRDFTLTVPPVPPEAGFSANESNSGLFNDLLVRGPRSWEKPQQGLHVERLQGPYGAPTWWRFGYWAYGESAPLPMALATQYRTELGFSLGESPVLVGNRVYKSYPNGAVSIGSLRRVEQREPQVCPEILSCCGSIKPSRGPGFTSTLPGPGDSLGDPPNLSGRDALATVHDMNPYVTFVPIDETGPKLAARLVVVSTRLLTSSLAWEVRYAFSCIQAQEGSKGLRVRRKVAYAYVDARSGALVFARDELRWGGAIDHDF